MMNKCYFCGENETDFIYKYDNEMWFNICKKCAKDIITAKEEKERKKNETANIFHKRYVN